MSASELAPREGAEVATPPNSPVQIEVRNLSVGAVSRETLRLGDLRSLSRFAAENEGGIRMVVWNEGGLSLVMNDRGLEVRYVPEIYPETEMFLAREHKREKDGFGGPAGNRVWEGEYEPVLFSKKDLLKFLANHSGGDSDLLASIKSLRVIQRKEESEEMLNLDSDDVRRVQEETESTNIPRHFRLSMPVTEGIDAVFEFEAGLHKPDPDDYMARREAKTKRIAVRMVNARSVLRDTMKEVLERLPQEIPRYYGRFAFSEPKER